VSHADHGNPVHAGEKKQQNAEAAEDAEEARRKAKKMETTVHE
jgi:hypothetical protein